ncbi:MAG: glucose-6-phosphate isomerase [Porticoccaceae bacterium]
MTANLYDATATQAWQRLSQLAQRAADIDIAALLARDDDRHITFSASCGGLFLDYAKNRVDDEILDALLALAQASPLARLRDAMFRGEPINGTENRPVLHTALRTPPARLPEELADIGAAIAAQRERMGGISDAIRSGAWRGARGDAITDVVNLGIGGSDLGPRLACEALKEFAAPGLRVHFVANVDGEVIRSTLAALNPATTVVILCSKTFTTQETLLNAQYARHWLGDGLGLAEPFASSHFIAVTAAPDNALRLGIRGENIIEFWDWVGGRYSLWSGVGLAIAIAIGNDHFSAMLDGAAEMDAHFRNTPWRQNMPVILALLGIWYGNFLGAQTQAVIPYCERLLQLPFYLQQLDMESNGKSVSRDGAVLNHVTGPILWGSTGTTGQHSFFQLLHQGSHLVPVDFIGVVRDPLSIPGNHRVLLANMLAQGAALMRGKTGPDLPPHKRYPGNRPSNTLLLEELSPRNFGALLALYEHKVFVQGAIWNINSFDQWGVEFGKAIANQLLAEDAPLELDGSTAALLRRIAR